MKHGQAPQVEQPTTEFDLERTPRFNPTDNAATSFARYASRDEADRLSNLRKEHLQRWAAVDRPGFSLIDRALASAASTVAQAGLPNQGIFSWTPVKGPNLTTPQTLGVGPYTASPEETASVVKSAARFFGASLVGVAALRKQWVFSHCRGKPVAFEETTVPGETDEGYVIPERCQWVVSCAVEMSPTNLERAPSAIGEAAALQANSRVALVIASLAQFVRALGYVAIPERGDLLLQVPFAVAAGLGELGRLGHLVTPEFGPRVRIYSVITDLTLAVDKPVDFGLQDFCRRCRICAEACPGKALSFEEEPSWEPTGPWNNPGKRAWYGDLPKCHAFRQRITTNCGLCVAACPWPSEAGLEQPRSRIKTPSGNGTEKQRSWWRKPLSPFGL